jgi:plastocyanin
MNTNAHQGGRLMAGLGIGAAMLIAAAGCGSSGSKSSSAAGAAASGSRVTVTDTDFHQAFSTMSFTPGTWTFDTVNAGKTIHSLEIDGPGVHESTPSIQPGKSALLTVSLQAGQYDVFCPVPGHKALGMDNEITVGSGGTASNAPAAPAAPASRAPATTAPSTTTTTTPTTTTSTTAPAPTTTAPSGSGGVSY